MGRQLHAYIVTISRTQLMILFRLLFGLAGVRGWLAATVGASTALIIIFVSLVIEGHAKLIEIFDLQRFHRLSKV